MKILISSIGSRGDVQPILALGLALRALGHAARLCVAPNFKDWVESSGLECLPIGPDLRKLTGGRMPLRPPKPSKAQLSQLAAHTVRTQFAVLGEAARECDLIVAGGTLQIGARSIAESLNMPYVFAAYCPSVIPSARHPPPKIGSHHSHSLPGVVNRLLWAREERRWNVLFRATLNEERAKLGLAPIASVQRHIMSERPWLAADPTLAPGASNGGMHIQQTGAWFLSDPSPLPDTLERFLAAGPAPVYFGFGSMRTRDETSRMLIESARALGLRAIISQGWGDLGLIDAGADCIAIGDVNHEKLFPRVAAVVHHGGAGITSVAARSGTAQVVVPHIYDQFYWAHRVGKLGVGVSGPHRDRLSVSAMVTALRECSRIETQALAQALATRIELHGAALAARQLVQA
jgi:vancomycin aglycone glucosyltransferase